VRVLTATNKDLNAAVAEGTFRKDLFYRLNVFPIQMPGSASAGRHSASAEYLIDRYAKRAGKRITKITGRRWIYAGLHWPGNIRELQNVIERAVILSDSDTFVC